MAKLGAAAMVVCMTATVGILYCTGSRYWQINSQVSSDLYVQGIKSYKGLWVQCASVLPGVYRCDRFGKSYLGLSGALNAQRAMMVTADIACVAGLIAGLLSLNYVVVIEGKQKLYSSRGAAVSFAIAGVLTLAAVSWYAVEVVRQFNFHMSIGTEFIYKFGTALFIGWIASALAILGAFLFACCTSNDEDEYYESRHAYKPSEPKNNYV